MPREHLFSISTLAGNNEILRFLDGQDAHCHYRPVQYDLVKCATLTVVMYGTPGCSPSASLSA